MNKIKLSKRLLTIANLVSGNIIADVGCDHGKLSYYLLKNNLCKFVYVSDISKPSLEKAESLLSSEKFNFKSIHCDGLSGFSRLEVDECIIAGMGGDEIMHIIKNSPINIDSFILSPQHNIIEVKQYLISHGYLIIYDKIIKDGKKFYNIFKCIKGNNVNYSDINLYFGKDYNDLELLDIKDYLNYEKNKMLNMFDHVDLDKKKKITDYLELINKAQKDWNI